MRSASSTPAFLGTSPFGLAAIALVALLPSTPARAQTPTQDLYVSAFSLFGGTRFQNTGPGTFSTVPNSVVLGNQPQGLAFDARGDLFATTYDASYADHTGSGTITEKLAGAAPGTFQGFSVYYGPTQDDLYGIAIDAQGNVFAADTLGNSIVEFASTGAGTLGAGTSFTDPRLNRPMGLAFDARGDLFATNILNGHNSITEFAAGATPGTFGATSTLADPSLNDPDALAFDARGDLFVANKLGGTNGQGSITEFAFSAAAGTFGGAKTFTDPTLISPSGLAFDATGHLFASNVGGGSNNLGSVSEFAVNPNNRRTRRRPDDRKPERPDRPSLRPVPARARSLHDGEFRPAAGPGTGRGGGEQEAEEGVTLRPPPGNLSRRRAATLPFGERERV